jgi:hypothetical protein
MDLLFEGAILNPFVCHWAFSALSYLFVSHFMSVNVGENSFGMRAFLSNIYFYNFLLTN